MSNYNFNKDNWILSISYKYSESENIEIMSAFPKIEILTN